MSSSAGTHQRNSAASSSQRDAPAVRERTNTFADLRKSGKKEGGGAEASVPGQGPGAQQPQEAGGGSLENQITNNRLVRLQQIFEEADEDDEPGLDIDEFKNAMAQVMPDVDERELEIVFMKVDANCDGTVDWDEYLSYMLLEYRGKDQMTSSKAEIPFPRDAKDVCGFNRDDIIRIDFLPASSKTRKNARGDPNGLDYSDGKYVTLSKQGVLNFWHMDLSLQKTFVLQPARRRQTSLWVTDLVVLHNFNMIAVASTKRDIVFYDINANKCDMSYRMTALEHCAMCLDYYYDARAHQATLLWGDNGGSICAVIFTDITESSGPFSGYSGKGLTIPRIPFPEILLGRVPYVQGIRLVGVHEDWVSKVQYYPTLEAFVSCCASTNTAMYMGDFTQKKTNSYFKCRKGILCFVYDPIHNILVTGGMDHTVRIWNPYVTTKAIVNLKGHNKAVVHLAYNPAKEQVMTIEKDKTLRVYSLRDQSCVQTIPGRKLALGSHVISAIFFNPRHQCLLLANNKLLLLERRDDEDKLPENISHNKPVCAALYNRQFRTVVSACHDSVINVWELNTGDKIFQIKNAHTTYEDGVEKGVEITCMTFDPSWRRLVTGARDGTAKIWNFNNGACLRELLTYDTLEITAVICVRLRVVLAGWSRYVSTYVDDKDACDEDPPHCWEKRHVEDILSIDFFPPGTIGTSSYDGDIILWSLDTGHMICRMNVFDGIAPMTGISARRLDAGQTPVDDDEEEKQSSLPVRDHRSALARIHMKRTLSSVGGRRPTSVVTETSAAAVALQREDLRPVDDSAPFAYSRQVSQLPNGLAREPPLLPPLPQSSRNGQTPPSRQRTAKEERRRHRAAVEKILFLQGRHSDPETATLMAAGAEGWIRAWSVHQRGGLLGQWMASHFPGDTVTSLATDDDNTYLISADSAGYVKVWDITEFCISRDFRQPGIDETEDEKEERRHGFTYFHFEQMPVVKQLKAEYYKRFPACPEPPTSSQPEKTLRAPLLVSSYRAHLRAITHVEYVPERELLITSSVDYSVRVWTLSGRFIGTLGEKERWSLPRDGKVESSTIPDRKPFDIRRTGSASTLRVLNGGIRPHWKVARNVVLIWASKTRLKHLHAKTPPPDPVPTIKELVPTPTAGDGEPILGKHNYRPRQRHKPMPDVPEVKSFHDKYFVYSSLPLYTDMQEVKEMFEADDFAEIQRRYRLTGAKHGVLGMGNKDNAIARNVRNLMAKKRVMKLLEDSSGRKDGQEEKKTSRSVGSGLMSGSSSGISRLPPIATGRNVTKKLEKIVE